MDESLAQVLVGNLLKNAMVHTMCGGVVEVTLHNGMLTVANSGDMPLDPNCVFRRFYHQGHTHSTGLGLAIVKSIADFYQIPVVYRYEGMHVFELNIVNIAISAPNS